MNIIDRIRNWLLKSKLEHAFFLTQIRDSARIVHAYRGHSWVYHRAESLVNGERVGKVVIRCCAYCDEKQELKNGEWVSRFADECVNTLNALAKK